VAAVLVLGLVALGVAGGAAWWYFGRRAADVVTSLTEGQAGGPTDQRAARASDTAPFSASRPSSEAPTPSAEQAVPPGGGAVPAATADGRGSAPAPERAETTHPVPLAPPRTEASGGVGTAQPPPATARTEGGQPPVPSRAPLAPAQPPTAARERDEPSVPASDPAPGRPSVTMRPGRQTEALTEDTVATLSGRRSGSLYEGSESASVIAAKNRITYVLEQYVASVQARDEDGLRAVRPSPSATELRWLEARQAAMSLEDVSIEVSGESAVARGRRTLTVTPASGAPSRDRSNVTIQLTRRRTGWVIVDIR